MVTNIPVGVRKNSGQEQTPEAEGFGERMMDRVREAFCALHGHDSLLQFEHDRMFLKCVSCGYESPGWALDKPRPVVLRAENRPKALVRPQLASARRIA